MNNRDHILWHAKTNKYCSEDGSVNGVVRFGKVEKAYVKNSKRGACGQKAATVLPDRTAATYCIYSSLSSFEFDIVGYGAPHDA